VNDSTSESPTAKGETFQSIAPAVLAELMKQAPVRLVDVRTPEEFERYHAEGATNVPLDELDPAAILQASADPCYLICRAGSRSRLAAEKIRAQVPELQTVLVEGGTLGWRDAELPIFRAPRPRKRPSLTNIIVVSLMVLSGLLAVLVHPGLLGISGLAVAYLVAISTLHPRVWLWADEPDVTEGIQG
jgi:rhodanese-related sulfurtransferase